MLSQDKTKEIAFFDQVAESQSEYNVFSVGTNQKIIDTCAAYGGFKEGDVIADLGCGSGIFSYGLSQKKLRVTGVDISPKLIDRAKKKYPSVEFLVGDVEHLPFQDNSLDGILLSGLIHHFPNPEKMAKEVYRVLKPGRSFVAFDPNRKNPFMWLYRDKASPLYSSKGVTENERPLLPSQTVEVFNRVGFKTQCRFLSGLKYKFVESPVARVALPAYNFLDSFLCRYVFPESWGTFVITRGTK